MRCVLVPTVSDGIALLVCSGFGNRCSCTGSHLRLQGLEQRQVVRTVLPPQPTLAHHQPSCQLHPRASRCHPREVPEASRYHQMFRTEGRKASGDHRSSSYCRCSASHCTKCPEIYFRTFQLVGCGH